jgi:glycosyltransferase involved in cell wall biosynthesis
MTARSTIGTSTAVPSRPAIAPVAPGRPRPLWSVMIPAYHCAGYLAEALASVLVQDPGPDVMQIEVVDDHSVRDDPAAVVDALGRGRVGFYRQPRNLGVAGNLETCLRRSRGRLVHLLHGDDAVRDGFYRRMGEAFEARPDIGAAFCRHIFMDAAGHWATISPLEQPSRGVLEDALVRLASEQRIMAPSMVVRREVYERLGSFDRRLVCSEDWEMWVRIAAHVPVWYEVEPLALYRMHQESNTGRHLRTGEDVRYTREAIAMFAAYLPAGVARRVVHRARRAYARAALETAEASLRQADAATVAAQVREALALSRSPRVVLRAARLAARWCLLGAAGAVRRRAGRAPVAPGGHAGPPVIPRGA